MIPRYSNASIDSIWSNEAKLGRWQDVELAVIWARVRLGLTEESVYTAIHGALTANENKPDIPHWLELDRKLHHDLNAFIEERQRFIPTELQSEFHKDMTSYDTEEAAFSLALIQSHTFVDTALAKLIQLLKEKAQTYRATIMLERTHGQGAKLRSFGGRLLTYVADLEYARGLLQHGVVQCTQSRLSGAIGNYGGGLTPEIEEETLKTLYLTPYIGATQIMPRGIYAPLAQSLWVLCETLGKIAVDFRLGARSGNPLWHEPFSKMQKGSSAMPHKKNTIRTEQMEGMVRMARGRVTSIVSGISTWEARAIEQSCVERVDWPDLFHITLQMLKVITDVLDGMKVYPDNMLEEIQASRCTYASDEAKNFLATEFGKRGLPANDAYRIIQLGSFCIFEPGPLRLKMREDLATNLTQAGFLLSTYTRLPVKPASTNLRDIVAEARLFPVSSLEADQPIVDTWNLLLKDLFADKEVRSVWRNLFEPAYLLKQEASIFNHFLDT